MDKFQLSCLRTHDLTMLRDQANDELYSRRKAERVAKRVKFSESLNPKVFPTKKDVEDFNASSLYSIPRHSERKHNAGSIYLASLIRQDWSHLYSGGDTEPRYYVYAHVNPSKGIFVTSKEAGGNYGGTPFYIGKGVGKRAYDLKRNQGHGKMIRLVRDLGISDSDIVKVIFSDLTEAKAFEIEAKLIYFFGTIYDKATTKKGELLNLETPAIPEFVGVMREYEKKKYAHVEKEAA